MLTYAQAAFLGLLQGVTELFPVSSLGHSVLVPQLLGWHIDQTNGQYLAFVVATHFATALVLLAFFWRDWANIVVGMLRSLASRSLSDEGYGRLGWLLAVGTVPAGLLGVLFQSFFQTLFGAGVLVAAALVINGGVLWTAELLRRRATEGEASDQKLSRLSFGKALGIGFLQAGALIPGFSRTGFAMSGGLLAGLSHEQALRFAFLLSTPIIFAAAVLELPTLAGAQLSVALVGALTAAVASYFSVKFLTTHFKTRTLVPFAIYCALLGALALILLA